MSGTHKQNAARKLAESLDISYQRALNAIEEALAGAYSSKSAVREPQAAPAIIPERYKSWSEKFNELMRVSDEFLVLASASKHSMADLESMVSFDDEIFQLVEELSKCDSFGFGHQMSKLLDRAVDLAAQGEFDGFHSWAILRGDFGHEMSPWYALERQGFAKRRDPAVNLDGFGIELNERGLNAFMVEDTHIWNEQFYLLLAPFISPEEQRDWTRAFIAVNTRNE